MIRSLWFRRWDAGEVGAVVVVGAPAVRGMHTHERAWHVQVGPVWLKWTRARWNR